MPGQPLTRAFIRWMGEEDREEILFDWIADGKPYSGFAAQLVELVGEPPAGIIVKNGSVNRRYLHMFLKSTDERKQKYQEAKMLAADSHAERAEQILDEAAGEGAGLTGPQASVANSRANYQKWLASVKNREEYGEISKGPAVQINLGDLHLDALRQYGKLPAAPVAGEIEGEVVDAEIVEENGE